MADLEERFITHAGATVRYLTGGDGPPLVLCHGFLGSAENFETWFDELVRIRTLVIPDLPGCGSSSPLHQTRHTAGALAAAVEAVCADAGVERYDLGGLCLGASVAMAMVRAAIPGPCSGFSCTRRCSPRRWCGAASTCRSAHSWRPGSFRPSRG